MRHKPQKLEMAWESENRISASKLEYHIKTLSKVQKEELIQAPEKLEKFLQNRLECANYHKVKNIH